MTQDIPKEITDTVDLADGTEIEVVDDEADSSAIITGATVSQSQKENLGNYENVEPHASIRAEFSPAIRMDSPGAEQAVAAKLRALRRVVDDHIEDSIARAVEAREYE